MRAIIICLSIFLIVACNKEDRYIPNYDDGEATVELNGKELKMEAVFNPPLTIGACANVGSSIAFLTKNDFGEKRLEIAFSNVLSDKGKFNVLPRNFEERPCELSTNFTTNVADGDATDGVFDLDDSKHNFLETTTWNEERVEGNFQVSFKATFALQAKIHKKYREEAIFMNSSFVVFK